MKQKVVPGYRFYSHQKKIILNKHAQTLVDRLLDIPFASPHEYVIIDEIGKTAGFKYAKKRAL